MPIDNPNDMEALTALNEALDAAVQNPPEIPVMVIENIMEHVQHLLTPEAQALFGAGVVRNTVVVEPGTGKPLGRMVYFSIRTSGRSLGAHYMTGALNRLASEGYKSIGHLAEISQLETCISPLSGNPNKPFTRPHKNTATFAMIGFSFADVEKIHCDTNHSIFISEEGGDIKNDFSMLERVVVTDAKLLELEDKPLKGDAVKLGV